MVSSSLRHQMEALRLLHDLHSFPELTNNPASSQKTPTLAERARESLLTRFEEILSQIISIEQDLMSNLADDVKTSLRRKDSVDLKNICLRMCVGGRGDQSDRNLKALRVCLLLIVNNLLSAVRHQNNGSCAGATRRLMGISITLPDI